MYNNSIKVKNYKCFKEELEGFEKIVPINVIIGKNNSGKSSLIDIIEALCTGSNNVKEVYSEYRPTYQQFEKDFIKVYGYNHANQILNLYFQVVQNLAVIYKCETHTKNPIFRWPQHPEINKLPTNTNGINLKEIFSSLRFQDFEGYKFRRLNAERDIKTETPNGDITVQSNGGGATNIIQQFLTRKDLQKQKLIKKEFLESINSIVKPEIEFIEILVQVSKSDPKWEICFEDKFGNNIFLSDMGSGIRTVILVLINLFLIPSQENYDISNYIFAFEELENNLHPSLQRKLYQFIKNFAETNKCIFFITTHSNIGIDIFYNSEISQLITVGNANGLSTCKTIVKNHHLGELLNELGFKASDLLQTNGIIWVEGPSDRVYIKRWIGLMDDTLLEGIHYSIMFYGGKLLSNLTFTTGDESLEEFISLLKINKNSFVVIDKDARRETEKIAATKERIQTEIGLDNCWITKGREIENYISVSSLNDWLSNKKVKGCENIVFEKFDKLEDKLPCLTPLYNRNKNGYAKEIINFINENDLDVMDLRIKLNSIVNSIKKWNA